VVKRRAKGEGSIFKEKSGYWRAVITFPDGSRKYKRAKRQSVVREWLQEQRQSIQRNVLLKDDKVLFGDYLDHLIDAFTPTLAPSTVESYQRLIRIHIKPELGHMRLVKLRPDHLQALYSRKLDAGLSNRTVQYIHAVIRRSLSQAAKWGLLHHNPTNAVVAPVAKREPPPTLSAEQAKLFLESVEGHRYYPVYFLAITTGLRKGELLGLQVEDVDLKRNKLQVKHTQVDIQGKTHLGQPKSAAAKRTITLADNACEAIKEHCSKGEGYVFTSSAGTPLSQRNLSRHFHRTLEKLGLPNMPFHALRHTAATLLLQANVHPRLVQEMLGHSTIVLTLDTYSHVIPGHHDEAADEMERIFG
jgi:integrase